MCANSADVVLFPLVPVMQMVFWSGCASNHNLLGEVIAAPAARALLMLFRYGLMPGERTRMSKFSSPACESGPVNRRSFSVN